LNRLMLIACLLAAPARPMAAERSALARWPDEPPAALPSIHQVELELHRATRPAARTIPDPDDLARARTRSLARVVYGYYPYWAQDLAAIRWSALTHLAWFALEMDADGQVTASHGWPDLDTVAAAHAAGVRVDLTFTLFSGSGIQTLCADPARRATAITRMIDAMEAGGADGISVDFEGLLEGTRDDFTTFIRELRQELTRRGHPDAQISIAGPAVDWTQAFDLPALLQQADWFFIMGYGYFWSGSARAGPVGMLRIPAAWRPYQSRSMLRSLAEYSRQIPAQRRHQILHGVPYYGREWVTDSDAIGASTASHVGSVTYSAARAELDAGRQRRFEAGVDNPWFAFQSAGAWHQVWYDDEQSLAAKYALALDQDLGGVGMWALNYDRPHAQLWDLLEQTFTSPPEPAPGHRHNPLPIEQFPFQDARDTSDGPGSYFNFYSCRPDLAEYGREWVYSLDLCQPGTLFAQLPDDPQSDPDLHLLDAPDQDACIARAHLDLEVNLEPGRYLLVVDTFVDDGVELQGPYSLNVDFVPQPGSQACGAHLVCHQGECECALPGLTDCGQACVDLSADVEHCGACEAACLPGQLCQDSACLPGPEEGPREDGDGGSEEPDGGWPDGSASDATLGQPTGCSCTSSASAAHGGWSLALSVLATLMRSSRRRRAR
jgi:GH18 family chitinase